MTDPETTPPDAESASASASEETSVDGNAESWEEVANAGYQERLREFDNVESQPVVSLPGQSSQLSAADLTVQPPGDRND